MSTTYTVHAQRDGKWWVLTAPAVPGAVAQARRLDQAPEEIGTAIAMMLGVPDNQVAVDVQAVLDDEVQQRIAAVRAKQEEAERVRDEAAAGSRELVAYLHGTGLTIRDIGAVLGLSLQRAQQLLASAKVLGSDPAGSALSVTVAAAMAVATAVSTGSVMDMVG